MLKLKLGGSSLQILLFFFVFISVFGQRIEDHVRTYEGYTVIEASNITHENMKKLRDYLDVNYDIVQLNENKVGGLVELAIPMEKQQILRDILVHMNAPFEIKTENLARMINSAAPRFRQESILRGQVSFDDYMTYDEIVAYLDTLSANNPELVTKKSIGSTSNGRDIPMVIITNDRKRKRKNNIDKPIIFIDGGIHAREWISPASVLYVIRSLLESPKMINNIEWRIVPVLNPDGYEYSMTTDRLWRKNRNRANSQCAGTDLNRNFDYHWMESGSSDKPCSEVYAGPTPFSEPESVALKNEISSVQDRVRAYISIHSYGRMIIYPYAYANNVPNPNEDKLRKLGIKMANAIKSQNGDSFSVNTAAGLLYPAAGGSDDYMHGAKKIPFSFTFELRDNGEYGFLLPASQIRSSGQDLWAAMRTLGSEILSIYGPPKYRTSEPDESKDHEDLAATTFKNNNGLQNIKTGFPILTGKQQINPFLIPLLGPGEVYHSHPFIQTPITYYQIPHLVPPGAFRFKKQIKV